MFLLVQCGHGSVVHSLLALCLLCHCSQITAAQQKNAPPLKVILDTDIGDDIDDAYALALLATRPNVKVLGVTTTYGQTRERAELAAKLLQVMGRADIPVYAGRRGDSKIGRQYEWARGFTSRALKKEAAIAFLKREIDRAPGEITLIAIGALTNLGDLLTRYPETASKIKQIVIMGGAVYCGYNGQAPPVVEWNIRCDPAAARTVFTSGVPLVMAGLEVTAMLQFESERQKRLFGGGTPLTDALAALTALWGNRTPTLFDIVPVAYVLGEHFWEGERLHVEVDANGLTRLSEGVPNVTVLLHPQKEALLDWYVAAFAGHPHENTGTMRKMVEPSWKRNGRSPIKAASTGDSVMTQNNRPQTRANSAQEAAGNPVGIGCVGVGGRGQGLLGSLLQIPGVSIRAICDPNAANRARAKKQITAAGQSAPEEADDWRRLLERADVDAVVSALPCALHAVQYQDTIAAGKDLYAEKPMCLSVPECNAVVAAANGSDRIVQVGFQRRADPRFIETMGHVHQGELGDLVEGRICWSNAWGPLYDWFGRRDQSGDWMVEQAVHNWDVMNWANRCLPVKAMGLGRGGLYRAQQPDRDVTDYYSALVEYENGVVVNILHSWVAPGQSGAFNHAFNDEYTRLAGTQAGIDFNTGTFSYRKELNKPDRVGHSHQGPIDSTLLALQAFVDSVRTRKPSVSTVEQGRDAVLACLLVREAVYRQGVVTMQELKASQT